MKLLLTASGITNSELEQAFLELTGHKTDLRVAIIPTAGDPIEWIPEKEGSGKYVAKLRELTSEEQDKREGWLHGYKAEYEKKGYNVSVMFVDLKEDPEKIRQTLETVDLIDVGGGDVNYLLDWAKIAKLDHYLKDLLNKGVVYIGTSAGAGLVVPDIGLTWWEPEKWAGTDHIGFGIVDFVVVPHQKESDERSNTENLIARKKYMQSMTDFPWKVYLLQDGQAIKVDGDKIEHIGPGIKKSI